MPKADTHRSTRPPLRASEPSHTPALPPTMRQAQPVATVPVSAAEYPGTADPAAYALVVDGDCLAPIVFSGDLVLVSPAAPLKVGEFVVLHPHQGRPLLKRLVCPPPPFECAPGSDVEGLVIVEQLNPPRHYHVPTRLLHSVHAVVGVMPRARHEAVRVPVPAAAAGAGGPIPGALARRGLLGAATALAVPVAGRAADLQVSAPHPDAEVLHLAAEFCDLERQHRRHDGTMFGTPENDAREAEGTAIMERQGEIADALMDMPARTLAGHQAVAAALTAWAEPDDYHRGDYMAPKLIGALLHGLVGRVPQDEPDEPVFVPTPAASRVGPPPNPDAGLVALCAEHMANWQAVTDHTTGNLEDCPYGRAYIRTYDLVSEAKPENLFGIMAKARAAKLEARNRDGSETWDGTAGSTWAVDVVNDLVRVAGWIR